MGQANAVWNYHTAEHYTTAAKAGLKYERLLLYALVTGRRRAGNEVMQPFTSLSPEHNDATGKGWRALIIMYNVCW